jgi:predicted acyl esterase
MKLPLSTRIARWIRRALPAPRFAVAYEPGLRTPMSDGVELGADHYFPTPGTLQDFPTLLVRTPHGRGSPWAALYGLGFAEQGFHVLLQSARGTADSGGVFRPWRDDGPDGRATIAWLRRQAWFDGRLGVVGSSTMAPAHWALAADPPPELKAMVMQMPLAIAPGDGACAIKEAADGLKVPTLVISGWADAALDQALQQYGRLPARHRSLVIGPWTHASVLRQDTGTIFAESLAWLQGHLVGPAPPKGHVRVAVGGTTEWRDLSTWPPAAVPMPWYLNPDGTLRSDPPRHDATFRSSAADLVFTSPPLTDALEVIGAVAADVLVELGSAPLHIRLCDLDERGRSRNICDGAAAIGGPPPNALTVAMSSTAHRFLPGHRIRVQISGDVHQGSAAGHGASRVRIRPGSALVLPAA